MSHKSNISLSNRALFYSNRKDTLQQHQKSQNSNVIRQRRQLVLQTQRFCVGRPCQSLISVRAHSARTGPEGKTTIIALANLRFTGKARFLLSESEHLQHETAKLGRSWACRNIVPATRPKWKYSRGRIRTQAFQDAEQPNKSNVTAVTSPMLPGGGLKEDQSSTQLKSNHDNKAYLGGIFSKVFKSNPKDFSVQSLERLGFTFSPFAFIFGTTFLFAALASTLQKQEGKQWLRTLSHTKLPGLTKNQIHQRSSWVFIESVLSQYIKRDSSLLISTTSLCQDKSDLLHQRKAIPNTHSLGRGFASCSYSRLARVRARSK